MGCKQYARMLGLSRGYPYILYLSLSKWDAAPVAPFFHKDEKFGGTMLPCHPSIALWPLTPTSRRELRSGVSKSEMGIFRVVGKGY